LPLWPLADWLFAIAEMPDADVFNCKTEIGNAFKMVAGIQREYEIRYRE
jgi:hypothetical protein